MKLAARAPDHLGDAVMALPALSALAALGPLTVHTRGRWAPELYAGFTLAGAEPPAAADVAVLFKPSWHAAFQWRHLRTIGVGPAAVYAVALEERREHRRERYARLAAAAGAVGAGEPVYAARGVAPPLPPAFVALNPVSPSATVRWPGFAALAARLAPGPVVAFCGPGEGAAARAAVGPDVPVVEGLSLPDFAAALAGATAFVSNDSGAAHFAAACGVPVVMVHGSTAPERTGVGRPVERPTRLWCQPCYRKTCLWGTPCLDVAVQAVLDEVLRAGVGPIAFRIPPPTG